MQAVILAAGMGNRLGSLTDDQPKSLVRVNGRELLLHVLDFLNTDSPKITQTTVVTGFMSESVASFLRTRCPKATIAENKNFKDGSILSMECALPYIQDDFLIMNADHIYPGRMFKKIADSPKDITAMCDFDRKLVADDMKVKLDENRLVTHISKTLKDFDGGYIGMTCCPKNKINDYREALIRTKSKSKNNASVEAVLAELAENGYPVNVCDTSGIRWLEIDTPEDLAFADRTLERNANFLL